MQANAGRQSFEIEQLKANYFGKVPGENRLKANANVPEGVWMVDKLLSCKLLKTNLP